MKITVKRVKQTTLTIDVDKIASISGINNGTNSFILFTTDGIEHEIVASEYNNLLAVIGTAGGGGGGSSSEYQGMPVIETTERVITLEPNNYYIFGECATLDISIQEPITNGRLNEYRFEFLSGTTPTVLTLPSTVSPSTLNIQENTKYVISIKNNVLTEEGTPYSDVDAFKRNLYNKTLTEIVIPEGVTSIPPYAFYQQRQLTKITLPSTITEIGTYAFYQCNALTQINLPEGITTIGAYAFYQCSVLQHIVLPSTLTAILGNAFNGCTILQLPQGIPSSVRQIDGSAFANCKAITSISIPSGITILQGSTFASCTGLNQVTIPNTVLTLGTSCFSTCSTLPHITIPNNVTTIQQQAFDACGALSNIEMYDSVQSLTGTQTFRNIYAYCKVRIYGTTRVIPFLLGCPATVSFYVDDSMVQAYKTNSAWSARASYIFSLNDYTP